MITADEWHQIITDFDLFMKRNGYMTVKEAADRWNISMKAVKEMIFDGKLKLGVDYVTICRKNYISFAAIKPIKDSEYYGNGETKQKSRFNRDQLLQKS